MNIHAHSFNIMNIHENSWMFMNIINEYSWKFMDVQASFRDRLSCMISLVPMTGCAITVRSVFAPEMRSGAKSQLVSLLWGLAVV